jgi:hypothetical protein
MTALKIHAAMRRILPLLFLFAAHAIAEELSVKPGINDKFLDPALKVDGTRSSPP